MITKTIGTNEMRKSDNAELSTMARNEQQTGSKVDTFKTGSKIDTFKKHARELAVGAALAVTLAVSGCATFPGQIIEGGILGGYVGSQIVYGEGMPYYSYGEEVPYYSYGGNMDGPTLVTPYYFGNGYDNNYYGYGGDIDGPTIVTPYYFGNGYGDDYYGGYPQQYRQGDDDGGDGNMWQEERRR